LNTSHTDLVHHVLGALSILSTVLGLLTPVIGAVPGPGGVIAGAVLGGLSYAVSALGKAFLPPPPHIPTISPKAGAGAAVIALFLALPALKACTLTPADEAALLASVDAAVAVAEAKGLPAADLNSIAKLVQAGDATAQGILTAVLVKANPKLTADEAALTAAIAEVVKVTGG
jgi:hypothetical protein